MLKSITSNISRELRHQYASPYKTMYSAMLWRYWSRKSRPLVHAAINELNVKPNDKILEIGYGFGDGFERLLDIFAEGEGTAFGYEMSEYAIERTSNRFIYEMQEARGVLQLDRPFVQALMPYPSRLMDGIYHVDTFYFWDDYEMESMCTELRRILQPQRPIVCAMNMRRLAKLQRLGLLVDTSDYDPVRYMECLEHVGFVDVRLDYRRIDADGAFQPASRQDAAEIQIIRATRPAAVDDLMDAEDPLGQLQREISAELAEQALGEPPNRRPAMRLRPEA